MSNHTPGPWGVSSTGTDVLARLTRAGGQVIAVMTNRPYAEAEANARLIAAAPDMYAALRAMLNPDETERDVDMALEALHKAEGR